MSCRSVLDILCIFSGLDSLITSMISFFGGEGVGQAQTAKEQSKRQGRGVVSS